MPETRKIFTSITQSSVRFYGALFLVFFTLFMILISLSSGYRDNLTNMRMEEIKRLVEIAINTIQPIIDRYEKGEINKAEALERVRDIVRRMTYRSEIMDNYMFMSSYEGIMLVQPLEPHLEYTYQWDSKDAKGNYYIRDLVKAARGPTGDGFVFYYYPPPGSTNPGKKLSYVRGLDSLGCYIGTGMYFTDINALVLRYLFSPLFIIVIAFSVISLLFAFFLRPLALCIRILVKTFQEINLNPGKIPAIPKDTFRTGTEEYELLESFEEMLKTMAEHREKLITADKYSSLGVLVAGVAHEINNPNQFVLSNAGLLIDFWKDLKPVLEEYQREYGDFSLGGSDFSQVKEEIPVYIRGILEGAERINKIVMDLKSFSRMDPPDRHSRINIQEIIESAITLCGNLIKNSTNNFNLQVEENLPPVLGNSQRLEQVVINLIQNACQAVKQKDKSITLRAWTNSEKTRVFIDVEDDGEGIEKEIIGKVTDPFFTTKRSEGGTGLGLSVSQSIITEHKGNIQVRSEKGKGTLVTVSLPASLVGEEVRN